MFSDVLQQLRKEAKLTQDQMADVLNTTKRTYGSWERSERQPDFETLVKIADYFGVTTDYLLGRTPVPVTIVHEPPPPETPPGMKRMVLKFDSDGADPDGKEPATFEQRVAEILEKELKKRGL